MRSQPLLARSPAPALAPDSQEGKLLRKRLRILKKQAAVEKRGVFQHPGDGPRSPPAEPSHPLPCAVVGPPLSPHFSPNGALCPQGESRVTDPLRPL